MEVFPEQEREKKREKEREKRRVVGESVDEVSNLGRREGSTGWGRAYGLLQKLFTDSVASGQFK